MYSNEEKEKIERCQETMGDELRQLSTKTRNMLMGIAGVVSVEAQSLLARDLDRRCLNALQNRGMIEVRDVDGLVSLTKKGENYATLLVWQSWQ